MSADYPRYRPPTLIQIKLAAQSGRCLIFRAAPFTMTHREATSGEERRMTAPSSVLAIDQGTTSSRAMLFDRAGRPLGQAQQELPQHFPRSGWVEHDPEDIWRDTVAVVQGALGDAKTAVEQVAAIGITNQRETTVIWDRASGAAIHKAIVWQDRRTAPLCDRLKAEGHEAPVQRKTGLLLDPYFSASKIAWLLDNVPGARARAEKGELAFGTIDSFLLWRLTGGAVHATDATNASRTLLYDIHEQSWSAELLELFGVPEPLLPEVRDNDAEFGATPAELFGRPLPITGMAGDQQAATVGQACFQPGMMKSTYGTGCFALMNTGGKAVASKNRLLTTIAYRVGGETTYALEGSIFVAGAAVQWLRDGLKVRRPGPGSLHGARLHRARCALLGCPRARRNSRTDPRDRPGRDRPRGARGGLLPDPRPARGHGRGRRPAATDPARRRRHGRQRLDAAASGRHPRLRGRAAGGQRDHGPGRGISGRPQERFFRGAGGDRRDLAGLGPFRAGHARRRAEPALCRLARGGRPSAQRQVIDPASVAVKAAQKERIRRRLRQQRQVDERRERHLGKGPLSRALEDRDQPDLGLHSGRSFSKETERAQRASRPFLIWRRLGHATIGLATGLICGFRMT
jgi:hypothetical protein